VPYDFFPRHEFSDPLGGAVKILVGGRKLSLSVPPSISPDHHPRTLLMASKTSSGDWSTEIVVLKFCCVMTCSLILSVAGVAAVRVMGYIYRRVSQGWELQVWRDFYGFTDHGRSTRTCGG
jgi:hypothetical protein